MLLEEPIEINYKLCLEKKFLPKDNKLSRQGYNYLTIENIKNLLKEISSSNKKNKKLELFINNFSLESTLLKETLEIEEINGILKNQTADSLKGIKELEELLRKFEKKTKGQKPKLKERISKYIERGNIGEVVKELAQRKCSVCKALKLEIEGFLRKRDGKSYVEIHHVDPISNLNEGALNTSNLITVCANHHRLLHYGNADVIEITDSYFKFIIDGKEIKIDKLKIDE